MEISSPRKLSYMQPMMPSNEAFVCKSFYFIGNIFLGPVKVRVWEGIDSVPQKPKG
jgi:hypothetical protein